MSYDEQEAYQELGTPAEFYQFVCGDTDDSVYRYTNIDRDFAIMGHTWKALPISRDSYKSSGKVERASLTITIPLSSSLSDVLTAFPPTQVISVTIWACHLNDPELECRAIWVGRLLSNSKGETEITLTCESTLLSLKRPGLRRTYSYGCPYVLYDEKTCMADKDAATVHTTVTAIDSTVVYFTDGWAGDTALEKYLGGMVKWRGSTGYEYRTIVAVKDSGLYITSPLRGVEVGTAVDIILGCSHTVDDCKNIHNNVVNYGGQPWIPTSNPVRYHPFW